MTELFPNVPQTTRDRTKFWLEMAFSQSGSQKAAKELVAFRNSLKTEEEKEYLDFCFNTMLERVREEQ